MMHCGYFDTARNGNHSSLLTPTLVGERCPIPVKFLKTPLEKQFLNPLKDKEMSSRYT